MPTWLNLIHQPSHVSVWTGGRKRYYSWVPPGDFPVEDGGSLVKWIQTLFISQNYVSPLWHCTKSKWKSLICCIDSHNSEPPFHTYGACPSLTQRYATLSPCHMAYCVAYSNFSGIWKLTMTNEQARGKMYHFLTTEGIEYIFFWKRVMYEHIFMKLRSTLVCEDRTVQAQRIKTALHFMSNISCKQMSKTVTDKS